MSDMTLKQATDVLTLSSCMANETGEAIRTLRAHALATLAAREGEPRGMQLVRQAEDGGGEPSPVAQAFYREAANFVDSLHAQLAEARRELAFAKRGECFGCGHTQADHIQSVAAGKAACCPDGYTLTVGARNAIRTIAAERDEARRERDAWKDRTLDELRGASGDIVREFAALTLDRDTARAELASCEQERAAHIEDRRMVEELWQSAERDLKTARAELAAVKERVLKLASEYQRSIGYLAEPKDVAADVRAAVEGTPDA